MNGKYITIEGDAGLRVAVLFPEDLAHATFETLRPLSAGFWSIGPGGAVAGGASISLGGMSPLPGDEHLVFATAYGLAPVHVGNLVSLAMIDKPGEGSISWFTARLFAGIDEGPVLAHLTALYIFYGLG